MKILGVESSAKAASVCLWEDGRVLAEMFTNNGLTHSKTVLPMVESLLRVTGIELAQIDRLAVANGPGSFTGLRIGAAIVKGLSWSREIPCVGVSTLRAMAETARGQIGLICPVMDARAGQVYHALFEEKQGKIIRLCEDRAIRADALLEELSDRGRVLLLGDGAEMCYTMWKERLSELVLLPEMLRFPHAAGVCACASEQDAVSAGELSISYIRLPQAERERLARLKKE